MKQTDKAPNYAPRAVGSRITNAATGIVFTGNPEIFAPHNATLSGTNRDFHTPTALQ